ncbi:hypothetical protein N9J72_00620 [Candidatus Gracilibacteria bacterium]|nr:hypothetical protein [Candidatus Gracilibacteria bacterium]
MGFENSVSFQEDRQKYNDIKKMGDLDSAEKKILQEKYSEDCEQVKDETQILCDDLRRDIEVYNILKTLGAGKIKKLQVLGGVKDDGIKGPTTYAAVLALQEKGEAIGMSIEQLLSHYDMKYSEYQEYFETLSLQERMNLQAQGGKDGVYGVNTFKNMLSLDISFGISDETRESIGEVFLEKLQNTTPALIRVLQKALGANTNGKITEEFVQYILKKYGNKPDFEAVMQREGIPLQGDEKLHNGSVKEGKEIFESRYGEFARILETGLQLPTHSGQANIKQESKYGKFLINFEKSGSKGMMQLTDDPFLEMMGGNDSDPIKVLETQFLFQRVDFDALMNAQTGTGECIKDFIPKPINSSLETIRSSGDISEIRAEIVFLKEYIKGDTNHFDHETNMLIGHVYMSYLYHFEEHGNIGNMLQRYNANGSEQMTHRKETMENLKELNNGVIPKSEDIYRGFDRATVRQSARYLRSDNISSENLAFLNKKFGTEGKNEIELALAILTFQTNNKMTPLDGKPGPATLRKIREENRPEIMKGDKRVIDNPVLGMQAQQAAKNSIEMSNAEFITAKNEAKDTAEYKIFREATKKLSEQDARNLQYVVGAEVDGHPGAGTYIHYKNSHIFRAGFSPQEAAKLEKIVSENGKTESKKLADVYGFDVKIFEEFPGEIEAGDALAYDPDTGVMSIIQERGGIINFKVIEGYFDSIESALDNNNPAKIFDTLANLTKDPKKKGLYIQAIKEFIHEYSAYSDARKMFCSSNPSVQDTGTIFTVDFRGDIQLMQEVTAIDLFGDSPYLKRPQDMYIRIFDEASGEFKSPSGKRLSIVSGTSILVPNQLEIEKIDRETKVTSIDSDNKAGSEIDQAIESMHPQLSKDLGDWIIKNYVKGKKNSCGPAVQRALSKMGIEKLPTSDRYGERFEHHLDLRPSQFKKVPVDSPWDVKPGGIIVYGKGATHTTSQIRKDHGHVEIRGSDGNFYSYYSSNKPAGSASGAKFENKQQYKGETGFIGYAYYPIKKTV